MNARCVVVATAALVSLQLADGRGESRAPKSLDIKPPKKLAKVVVPKDAPTTAPAKEWWTQTPACPDGARHDESEAYGRRTHRCLDGKDQNHGPYTVVGDTGVVEHEAWYRHGNQHGLERITLPQRALESYTYVDGEKHGPADEFGDTGTYYRGQKHGLWTVIRGGSTPQLGYYVAGEREGVWLSRACKTDAPCVIARATYRRDQPTGAITWWTEDGAPLATGTISSSGDTTWELGAGKYKVTLSCHDHRATSLRIAKDSEAVSCTYGETGELVEQTGGQRGVGCPADGAHRICEADILDPYKAANAIRRIWQ